MIEHVHDLRKSDMKILLALKRERILQIGALYRIANTNSAYARIDEMIDAGLIEEWREGWTRYVNLTEMGKMIALSLETIDNALIVARRGTNEA